MSCGTQVAVRELARARVGPRVVGGDDALVLERRRSSAVRRAVQRPLRIRTRRRPAPIRPTHRMLDRLVVEPPHAQPLDAQRVRGNLEDAAQPLVEPLVGIGVARRQVGQRVALRHQPSLARLERGLGRELLADVVEDGQHGGLALPRDEPRRGKHPERLAGRSLDPQPEVVRATAAAKLVPPAGSARPGRRSSR